MLRISTFNIQNNIRDYKIEKARILKKYLEQNNIDILALQEMFSSCEKDLIPFLKKIKYTLQGNYRYKLKIMNQINESNPIITREKVLNTKTIHLPFLPSTLKRIVTISELETSDMGNITIMNTHLDFMFDQSKKRQLDFLLKLIKQQKGPIVITGDFNLKNNNEIFNKFCEQLELLNIYRVPINEKTLKSSTGKRAIDHIFISNDFVLKDVEVIKNISISDHYPVLIKVDKNNKMLKKK